jgi:crotonobetaine/carnitine-CoA ligase
MLKRSVTEDEIKGSQNLRMWMGWPVDEPMTVRRRWPNIKFIEGYGTTEAPYAAIVSYDAPELETAGPITPFTNLKIIDPQTKKELPKNTVGEIVYGHKLGADYIVKEYYKDHEKSKEMIKNGYWYSGDMGMVNEKGQLIFVDRIKDYLRVGGENVSSTVVEEVIRRHSAVAEVAIVGQKGELGHDEIVAHVVLKKNKSLDAKEFFEFCNNNMSYFMVPKYLVIRSELPKTATERIEKYKLRNYLPENAIDRESLGILLKR